MGLWLAYKSESARADGPAAAIDAANSPDADTARSQVALTCRPWTRHEPLARGAAKTSHRSGAIAFGGAMPLGRASPDDT